MNTRYFAVVAICVALMIVRCSDPVSSEEESYTLTADTYEPDNLLTTQKLSTRTVQHRNEPLKEAMLTLPILLPCLEKLIKFLLLGKPTPKFRYLTITAQMFRS
jgi:hypothetical protein